MATPARPKVFKNFINGEWVEARSGKAIENRNPAEHRRTGRHVPGLHRGGRKPGD